MVVVIVIVIVIVVVIVVVVERISFLTLLSLPFII